MVDARVVDDAEVSRPGDVPEPQAAVVVGDRQGLAVGAEVERADAPSMAEESGDLTDIDLAKAKDSVRSKGDDVPPRDVHRSRPFEVAHGLVAPARAAPRRRAATSLTKAGYVSASAVARASLAFVLASLSASRLRLICRYE